MTRDKIDILWHQAMNQAVKDGEPFTRYDFAKLVAAAEREACADEADHQAAAEPYGHVKFRCANIAAAIRARGNT